MAMTKRNYEDAAKLVRAKVALAGDDADSYEFHVAVEMCATFVSYFKADNSRFDEKRFVAACGL